MMEDIFKQARVCITKELIEKYFHSPGAKWNNSEYFTLNPLRYDKHIGSFHISEKGLYVDHSTQGYSGDFINLVAEKNKISKLEAAKKIIQDTGGYVVKQTTSAPKKKNKKFVYADEDDLTKLNSLLSEEWVSKKFGDKIAGYIYRANNKIWCCVVRFNKAAKKNIIPFHYTGEKWKAGNPIEDKRPLFNFDEINNNKDLPILIVEGEKCAEVKVEGYVLVTWIGGTNQVRKTDFSILKNRKIFIWPDLDEPGKEAADYILSILPNAKILDVWKYFKDK